VAKIFIIDDDASVVQILEQFLRKRGYEVGSSTDGMTAAQACAKFMPDLLLLDFIIPAADGRVMLDRVRSSPGLAKVPVLVITGAPLTDVMARLPDRGLRFIEKPFDNVLLEKLINELLGPLAHAAPPPPAAAPLPPPGASKAPPPPLSLSDDDEPASGGTIELDL
jgi:DNA-binding response OmpR family regulator